MKRFIALIVVLSLPASFAMGDYVDPPGWESNPYFTHQSWEFRDNSNPAPPDGDVSFVNPYGMPLANIDEDHAEWWLQGYGDNDGGWVIRGETVLDPMNPEISLYIPNDPNPELIKEVWVQITAVGSWLPNPGDEVMAVFAVANGGQIYIPHEFTSEVVGPFGDGRVRSTMRIDIDPQPDFELINFAFAIPENAWINVEEIDVDTRCVPEPATLAMLLGAGLIGFAVYRRRK